MLLFNRTSVPTTMTATKDRVGITTRRARVRDLRAHTDAAAVEARYSAVLPSHGIVMLRVWPIVN